MNQGQNQFQLAYQVSPIVLTNGIAATVPGGLLPVISITQAQDYQAGLLSGGDPDADLDSFFAQFIPMPGATLIDNQIGNYPFANQAVAANAIITQPLRISLLMICPVRDAGGYQARLSVMSNLQAQLAKHNNNGGTYTVATPSFLYTDLIMTGFKDVSGGESRQVQDRWQLDFIQPLLTLASAQAAQNSLMAKIGAGVPVTGDPPTVSGQQPAVGNPLSTQGPSTVPAATPLVGASAGGAAQ